MNRRALDPLEDWPVIVPSKPWRWTLADAIRDTAVLLVGLILGGAALLLFVLWMGAVIEAVPR